MSHTPPPYYIGDRNDDGWRGPPGEIAIMARVAKGQAVGPLKRAAVKDGVYCVAIVEPCGIDGDRYPELTRANAEFIVRAVNAHDALVAACRAMLARCEVAYNARVKLTGIVGGGIGNEIEQAKAAINLALSGVHP
jgi:hypothetical protein